MDIHDLLLSLLLPSLSELFRRCLCDCLLLLFLLLGYLEMREAPRCLFAHGYWGIYATKRQTFTARASQLLLAGPQFIMRIVNLSILRSVLHLANIDKRYVAPLLHL